MNLGRFTIALLVAAAFASVIAGCGGSDSSSSAAPAQSSGLPSAATGGGDDSSSQDSGKKSSIAVPKAASNSDYHANASAKAPIELSKTDTKQVKLALRQMMSALSKDDVDYLCDEAYSKEFLAQTDKKGGCRPTLTEDLSSVESISAKVQNMVWVEPNIVAASVVLKRDTSAKLESNPATIYFTKEGGSWKRAVQPAN